MTKKEQRVIEAIKDRQPKSVYSLLDYGDISLRFLGGGAFRDAYHILGTSLVVKIPRLKDDNQINQDNRLHALQEWYVWERIKKSKSKKLAFLKPHLPEFLLHNSYYGVTVVRKYRRVRDTKVIREWCDEMTNLIEDAFGSGGIDLHNDNLGRDEEGNLRFTDMGMFADLSTPD